jgi:glutaredoxin
MGKELYVFTMNGCSHCEDTKKRLINERIEFHDLDVNIHEDIWNKVIENTNQDNVPTICIIDNDDDDNGTIYVPETDFNDIDELFNIIYKNIKGT